DHVKLVETKEGQTGCYVALSHCWGSPENHPLETTKENYGERLAGVPLENLPKTFRGVVKITNHIGVKYLWIDSLCIIQDDTEDWKQEAAKMGAVYEYARLTIAAADA
ncbi:heterokaryon incompatibility, partial [Clohesyomyces aquaticus]